MSGEHHSALQKLSRVCGNNVYEGKTPRQYKCCDHQADLRESLALTLPSTASSRYILLNSATPAKMLSTVTREHLKITESTHKVTVREWEGHVEGNCKICNPPSAPSKLGRPKKLGKEGRPPLLSVPSLLKYINDIAPKDTNTEKVKIMEIPSEYLCPLCNQLLNKPIELSCGKYACARCCCNDIKLSNSFTCPSCHHR